MTKLKTLFAGLLFCLTGCSSISPADYASHEPKLDAREYLNGNLEAHGVLIDFTGKADTTFTIKCTGTWNGNDGLLVEDYVYNDGRTDHREMKIKIIDEHKIVGEAEDVIGGSQGTQDGNAINTKYTLRAKQANGKTIDVWMDDWMYRMSDKVVINRIKMYKLGINVGELIITFEKK